MRSIFLFLLLATVTLIHAHVSAQVTVQTTIPQPNFLYQCADSSAFTVKIRNNTAAPLTGIAIAISQPSGIVKVGNATAILNLSAVGVNDPVANNNSSALNFSFGVALQPNDSLTLTYWAKALCNTANLSYQNTINVTYTGGTLSTNTLSYTVQVPFLELSNPSTPTSSVSCVNDQFTQVVRVRNNGNFNSFMRFVDIEITHSAAIGIVSTTRGTITTIDGNTVVRLSGSDFNSISNNDNKLDYNEELTFTITGRLLSCITATEQVQFQPLYRCNASETAVCRRVPEVILHTLTVASPDTPPALTATPGCTLGSSSSSLVIENTGTTTSQNVRLTLSIPATCGCQAIDRTSFLVNGTPTALTIISQTPTSATCLSGNANNVQNITVSLPDIIAGGTLTLAWDAPLCGQPACATSSIRWDYQINYQSTCCPPSNPVIGSGNCSIQPNLTAAINPSCTNGTRSLTITNNGNRDAQNIAIRLFHGAGHLSGINNGSVSASAGNLSFVSNTAANVCSNPNLSQEVNYNLDFLSNVAPNNTVTISWEVTSCETFDNCTPYLSEDYGYEISYQQACGGNPSTVSGGQTRQESAFITDTDQQFVRNLNCTGAPINYRLNIVFAGESLTYTDRYAEIVIDLPPNIVWDGVTSDLEINGSIAPNTIIDNGSQLIARYDLPLSLVGGGVINPNFIINCVDACNGVQNIQYRIDVYNACAGNNAPLYTCDNLQFIDVNNTTPDCAIPPDYGCVSPVQATTMIRVNVGADDGDNDRYADTNTSNQNLRLRKRLMFGDTLQTDYNAIITGTTNSDSLVLNIILYHPENAPDYSYLNLEDLDVSITDASAGGAVYNLSNVFACAPVAGIRDTLQGRLYTLTLTEAAINICYPGLLPSGFQFGSGDGIAYTIRHSIISNLGVGLGTNSITNLQVITDAYLVNNPVNWTSPLPILPGCPSISMDSVQVVGYEYDVSITSNTADVCRNIITANILHDFDIMNNTGNLNVFPYEYRPWVRLRTVTITLPQGYTTNPANAQWTFTTPPHAITPAAPPSFVQSGNQITYTLLDAGAGIDYYTANNISTDDAYRVNIVLDIESLCNVPTSPFNRFMLVQYQYDNALPLNGTTLPIQRIFNLNTNVPDIVYDVQSAPVSCTGTQATWTFTVTNSASSSIDPSSPYYNWLHIETLTGAGFSNITLAENGTPITPDVASGFYLLGNIPKGTTNTYTLTADYTNAGAGNCYNNALRLFYGWSCDPINLNFTTANFKTGYTCRLDSTDLAFEAGANTVLIDVVGTTSSVVNVCDVNNYTARVRNVGQNALRDVRITVLPPTGFTLLPGSFTYSYPPASNTPFTNGDQIINNFAVDEFFDISFQYTTSCLDDLNGAAQFFIKIDVQTCCDGDTLAAYPLPALDVSEIFIGENRFNIGLSNSPALSCSQKTTTFTINLTNVGSQATTAADSVIVNLPVGLEYVAGSITTNVGSISDANMLIVGNQLVWRIDPSGTNPVSPSGSRIFTIDLEDVTTTQSCSNFGITVRTFQTGITACANLAPPLTCTRRRTTGSQGAAITVEVPNLAIINYQQTTGGNPSGSQILFRNNGLTVIPAGTNYQVRVFFNNVFFQTLLVTVPSNLFTGDTFTYDYNTISCSPCVVRMELNTGGSNCLCASSQDQILTDVALPTAITLTARYLSTESASLLEWQVPIQHDIQRFVLERSYNLEGFVPIATLTPQEGTTRYAYTDRAIRQSGIYYYRVRTDGAQGNSSRSNIAVVQVLKQGDKSLHIYPNPFGDFITLAFDEAPTGKIFVSMSDMSGRELAAAALSAEGKKTTWQLPVSLSRGTYVLRVRQGNRVWTHLVVRGDQ